MKTRLLHAADLHLGNRQYGSRERYLDFAATFAHLVDTAIERDAEALLLAGDIFHRHAVAPETLLQAARQLRRLERAGIACYAIEGNHDRALSHSQMSWLQYLADSELLILLSAPLREGAFILEPWSADTRRGCWIDLDNGQRIVGVGYAGANTRRLVNRLARMLAKLPSAQHTTLMLHCGIDGTLNEAYRGVLKRTGLDVLRPHVDYVALGHVHRPFAFDGWVHNPGSAETVNSMEADWDDRGYWLVDVEDGTQQATQIRSKRRPYLRIYFKVDPFGTPDSLYRGLREHAEAMAMAQDPRQQPLVALHLSGALQFDRASLDFDRLQQTVSEPLKALLCHVRNTSEQQDVELLAEGQLDRAQLEREVLLHLANRDARHRPFADAWADMARELKQLALDGAAPERIVAEVEARALDEGLLSPEPADDSAASDSDTAPC